MQSGISASSELLTAFNTLVSSPDQRAVLANIQNETLQPVETIPLQSSTFTSDLSLLSPHLTPKTPLYILLKTHPSNPDGYCAITYVPQTAPVREKMLFASTRLTLVRELGIERFRETVFVTDAEELTPEGWKRHERHGEQAAPLTEEEEGLRGVKEAEARESMGTGVRRGHVGGKVEVATGEGVVEALKGLMGEGGKGGLVQLHFELPDETLKIAAKEDGVSAAELGSRISADEPRYSFYSYDAPGYEEPQVVFLYTCPTGSKVKERMVYSTGKLWTRQLAERDAGVVVAKSLEASEPSEITQETITKEFEVQQTASKSQGFSRPKRPGRR
ncbi:hypothetical protein MBLNU230_g0991t1 [Neophaeotheca triangularis]